MLGRPTDVDVSEAASRPFSALRESMKPVGVFFLFILLIINNIIVAAVVLSDVALVRDLNSNNQCGAAAIDPGQRCESDINFSSLLAAQRREINGEQQLTAEGEVGERKGGGRGGIENADK